MKVFVSSTCYDLIDMRAEVAEFLRSCGIFPVLSDDKLSDFAVKSDKNSIETCLVNAVACDEMIVILDRRYGPPLTEYGYGDISATHLEYRRFLETKRHIHFFVRDRLVAEHAIWKRNGRQDKVDLVWVKDRGLFGFLEERQGPTADKDKPNWISTFTTSCDLKESLKKYYDDAFLPQRLEEAIYNNTFPTFHVSVKIERMRNIQMAKVIATNVGTTTALNTRMYFANFKTEMDDLTYFVAPNQSIDKLLPIDEETVAGTKIIEEPLFIEYESHLGVCVEDRYTIETRWIGEGFALIINQVFQSRRYVKRVKPGLPVIEESAVAPK